MQSVYKYPISLAVMHLIDSGKYKLTDSVEITKSQLHTNTWSPLRDQYPDGIKLPIAEIIKYTIAKSDNNTSDILFDMAGGAEEIDKFLKQCRVWQVNVKNTEDELHGNPDLQFQNDATPWGMISLLSIFVERRILREVSYNFLWDVMASTETGSIKNKLPSGTVVAHKTGSSGKNSQGVYSAVNDAGIMVLPSGKKVAYAIFITDSHESEQTNYDIISDLGLIIYNYYSKNRSVI